MLLPQTKLNYPTAGLRLADGFRGIAALRDSAGHVFSIDQWQVCLADIDRLVSEPEEVLKHEGENSVIVKTLTVGPHSVKAVIKIRSDNKCDVRYPSLRRPLQNFKKAVILKDAAISAETPLAALWKQRDIFTQKSIYITEYVPPGVSLHWFVKRDLSALPNQPALKRHLAHELARILAGLHDKGMWHRDAKPSNFLIYMGDDGRHHPMFIDLDGIKYYHGLWTFRRRFSAFAHLAGLRLISRLIYRTDCLRTFSIYCTLTGLNKAQRRRFFRRLVEGPAAARLSALKLKGRTALDTNSACL
jgi:serine/threonine protein kinase